MVITLINTVLVCASLFDSLTYTNKTVQQYHEDCTKAITYKVAGDYQNAITLYENAFKTLYPFHDDIKQLLDCYYQTGQQEKYSQLLKYAEDQGYYHVHSSHLIFTRESVADKWQEKYYNAYDAITKKTFPSYVVSQKERPLAVFETWESISIIIRPETDKSEVTRKITHIKMTEFFINYLESENFIDRNESRIWESDMLMSAIIHMLQCCEKDQLEKLVLLLWKQVDKGNLLPTQFASFYSTGGGMIKENFFGTNMEMVDYDPQTHQFTRKFKSLPCSLEEINRRRAKIFIPDFETWTKIVNASYDFNPKQ